MVRTYALTGTPGTGKSSASAVLRRRSGSGCRVVEVYELEGSPVVERSTPRRSTVTVDMDAAARQVRALARQRGSPWVVVGHLAHLLPVHQVIVLRTRPDVLVRRLRRRGDLASDVRANVEVEAIDLILQEARHLRRPTWRIDTTDLTPAEVAREVLRIVRSSVGPPKGSSSWLQDPRTSKTLSTLLRTSGRGRSSRKGTRPTAIRSVRRTRP